MAELDARTDGAESRKVFLSHSSSDTAEIEVPRAALEGRGIACFLDALELKAGELSPQRSRIRCRRPEPS